MVYKSSLVEDSFGDRGGLSCWIITITWTVLTLATNTLVTGIHAFYALYASFA